MQDKLKPIANIFDDDTTCEIIFADNDTAFRSVWSLRLG
jgi:hypothetical protein